MRFFQRRAIIPGMCGLLLSSLALSQTITSAPVSTVPAGGPIVTLLLFAGIVFIAWYARSRGASAGICRVLMPFAALILIVPTSDRFAAQVMSIFTSPSGETLPIPVNRIPAGDDVAGFEVVDYRNGSSRPLRIESVSLPSYSQCFPDGRTSALLPPQPGGVAGPAACSVGRVLPLESTCRVDVDAVCRAAAADNTAAVTVTGSPLGLIPDGPSGQLTLQNTSPGVTAMNISADFSGTALAGNVTETSNTCANLAPAASCTLTFTPGSSTVSETEFSIRGDNTNAVTAAIAIEFPLPTLDSINPVSGPASGGTGITLSGSELQGATSLTFDGVAATSLNVVNSTTLTAVTPAHAAGSVDVQVTTAGGTGTLAGGYTYEATAVGQNAAGGTIAALEGGVNNLIAASADSSVAIAWGGSGTVTGAQSSSDGASNTATIVSTLGNNGGTPYAAQLCQDYEIDSQGNTPCQAGNACYSDWFLPSQNQLNAIYSNRAVVGGFASALYLSSTEFSSVPATSAFAQDFVSGSQFSTNKSTMARVRCVRQFTP